MTTNFGEVIRSWLGWCPDRIVARRPVTFQSHGPVSSVPLGSHENSMPDMIVDYGTTGISIRLFTIILAGTIAWLFIFISYGITGIWSFPGILVISILLLVVAVRMVYIDIKKAAIEFTPDEIIVKRPLPGSIIIPRDAITSIEIRKNIQHSRRWLFRGVAMIFFMGIISQILLRGDSEYLTRVIDRISLPVFLLYSLSISVFFGVLFYHGYIRSHHSEVVAIRTNDKKIVGLYVDDPGLISEALSKWRAGVV